MKQKALDKDLKILLSYISSGIRALEIWAQVYEITNPITEFRLKSEKRLRIIYEWLLFLNVVFLAIYAYKGATIIYNDNILMIVLSFLFSFAAAFMILRFCQAGFMFILRCYTITGYKSIWLFIIAFFIPQICCAVCSIIYFFS